MNYSKLVKALRCKRDDCDGCDLAFLDNDEGWMCRYAAKDDDAADAIEELSANVADKDYQIREQWDEIQRLRADVKRQQEKMIELAKKLLKRGEWKPFDLTYGRSIYSCSVCEQATEVPMCMEKPMYAYCPNCGAKMTEVQE